MPRTLSEQVVVITGASSGIGRETAIELGMRGGWVVLAARNEQALRETAREVERAGGKAHIAGTDVAIWPQVERLAQEAVDHFGRIDTWVNNAAVSEYATVEQMSMEEIQQIIQIILMGQIHGMKAALPHLVRQNGGTVINVASALAKRSVPLQSAYCAAKHGIKGFTESFRMELQHEHPDITVTLILPSSINTPLFRHARSKLGVLPKPMPPIYEPQAVAEAILFAVEHPRREIVVGGAGKLLEIGEALSPSLLDWYMLRNGKMFTQQQTQQPDDGQDNLFESLPGKKGSTTGEFGQKSKTVSLYTRHVESHPVRKRMLTAAAAALALLTVRRVGR
jgi:short-subunit dehydrogenase